MVSPLWPYPGGKRTLAPRVVELLTARPYRRYVEPCLGAGAAALAMPRGPMLLGETDRHLLRLWHAVRNTPHELHAAAQELAQVYPHRKDAWDALREHEHKTAGLAAAAATWLLLLGCFNGLYRRNPSGRLNVPWGDKKRSVPPFEVVEQAAGQLSGAILVGDDVHATLARCGDGDVVYVDPPYVDTQPYGSGAWWRLEDLQRLVVSCEAAARRGARIVLSHTDDGEDTGTLLRAPGPVRKALEGWDVQAVEVVESITCKVVRGSRSEVLAVLDGESSRSTLTILQTALRIHDGVDAGVLARR